MSKNSKPNVEALKNTMAIVEEAAKHDLWNQGIWVGQYRWNDEEGEYVPIEGESLEYQGQHFCNTAGCFAGWAMMLDGWKPRVNKETREITLSKDGHDIDDWAVEAMAKDLLGLSTYEAANLFNSDNTLKELRALVDEFIGEEEQTNA